MEAFEKFKEINKLPEHEIQKKHREWLKDYEGKKYSMGEDGHHTKDFKWTETSYKNSDWKPAINMIAKEQGWEESEVFFIKKLDANN